MISKTSKILSLTIITTLTWLVFIPAFAQAQSFQCECNLSDGSKSYPTTYPTQDECKSKCQSQCPAGQGFTNPCPSVGSSGSGSSADTDSIRLTNPIGDRTIPQIIGGAIKVALGIVGSIALALFVYGGFMWMTAGGNTQRVGKGRDILVWASIGLVVVFTSYAILTFVLNALRG